MLRFCCLFFVQLLNKHIFHLPSLKHSLTGNVFSFKMTLWTTVLARAALQIVSFLSYTITLHVFMFGRPFALLFPPPHTHTHTLISQYCKLFCFFNVLINSSGFFQHSHSPQRENPAHFCSVCLTSATMKASTFCSLQKRNSKCFV